MRRWPIILVLQLQLHAIHATLNENLVCDDFYDYACAGWTRDASRPHAEPFWSVFTDTAQRIATNLRTILEDESVASSVADERRMYAACVSDAVDFTKELQFLVNKLGGVQLASPKNNRYDFLMHLIEVTKLLNIHPILKFYVKHNMLYIERGDFIFPEMFLRHSERFHHELKIYTKWIENSLLLLYNDKETSKRRKHANFALRAKEIVAFEVKLSKLPHSKPLKIDSNQFDKIILHFLLGDTRNVQEIHLDETYFDYVTKMTQSMHWQHTSNYIIWTVIKELSRNVNAEFRRLSFEVDRQLLGVTADISRERECIDETLKYIGSRNLQEYFHILTKQPKTELIHEVKTMANEIRNVFLSRIQRNKSLSNKAKKYILKTVENTKLEILNPENTQQEKYTTEWSYFKNLIHLKAKKFEKELRKLSQNQSIQWPGSIFEVNAFYSPSQNAIVLPLGILQPPFFDISQSDAANYGAVGALIGHEFSHVLDNLDQQILTQSDVNVLNARRNCSAFLSPVANDFATLNENLADFTGIRLSYYALLSKYSNDLQADMKEELFFLSYARMWCELSGDETKEILMLDEHAPVAIRVKATLQSFSPFSKTFNCYDVENAHSCLDF